MEAILFILFIHYIGDFVIQTDKQAKGKSTNVKFLTAHICTYSLFWFFVLIISGFTLKFTLLFTSITFVAHWITDFFTSKGVKYFFDKGQAHEAFEIIGFDQILHYTQLFYTFKLLVSLI